MAVNIADRPIDKVREEVVDQLVMNYSHGELSHEAFERRLDQAMASKSNQELIDLVADLELKVDEKYIEQKKEDFKFNYSTSPTQESELLVNIFSGSERSGEWRVAKEIKSVSIFGGCDIDFSEAIFTQREVTVKVFCLFGGVDIYVPENVKVVTKAFCILSIPVATAPEGAKGGVGTAVAIAKPVFRPAVIPLAKDNALSIFLIIL